MANHTFVSIHYTWLVVLCAIAIACTLVVPLTTESTGISYGLGALLPNNADNDTVDLTDTCDQLEDSAMPAGAGSAWLPSVMSLLDASDPAGKAWLSAPPVRPPIVLN